MRLFQTLAVCAIRLWRTRPHTKLGTQKALPVCVSVCGGKEKKQNHRSLKATSGLNSARALEFSIHHRVCFSFSRRPLRASHVSLVSQKRLDRRWTHKVIPNPEFDVFFRARFNLRSHERPKALCGGSEKKITRRARERSVTLSFEFYIVLFAALGGCNKLCARKKVDADRYYVCTHLPRCALIRHPLKAFSDAKGMKEQKKVFLYPQIPETAFTSDEKLHIFMCRIILRSGRAHLASVP